MLIELVGSTSMTPRRLLDELIGQRRSMVCGGSVNGGYHVQVQVAVNDHVKVQVHVAVLA